MNKKLLADLYINNKKSVFEISKLLGCSEHKINYWLAKHGVKKRSISEAIYNKYNPNGDPFNVKDIKTLKEAKLLGLGLGLYWGEGTKSNKHTIRLGNTDPHLIKQFIKFLKVIYNIDNRKLKFGLQIFSDMQPNKALDFWISKLGIDKAQFQKVIVTPARSIGTYRNKTKHGVLTIYFNNKKLRDILNNEISKI